MVLSRDFEPLLWMSPLDSFMVRFGAMVAAMQLAVRYLKGYVIFRWLKAFGTTHFAYFILFVLIVFTRILSFSTTTKRCTHIYSWTPSFDPYQYPPISMIYYQWSCPSCSLFAKMCRSELRLSRAIQMMLIMINVWRCRCGCCQETWVPAGPLLVPLAVATSPFRWPR